ncbi:MAG: hypothetical protein L7U61_02720 [Flavobacteriaceae bacterium]|jgi:uncharacterized protein YqgV (UPF0045/DUF77 family)|nr:hypothetical protein [Flavobacteriaceae bacterium]
MNISVEITFTPLHDKYKAHIQDFITNLRTGGFTISETPLSTQLYGSYDELMTFLTTQIKTALSKEEKAVMHLKLFNANRSDYVPSF